MIYIAHRGNIEGPIKGQENTLEYLWAAIDQGYDVSADVGFRDGSIWLGTHGPNERLGYSDIFGLLKKTWFICRDVKSVEYLASMNTTGVFRYLYWNYVNSELAFVSNGKFWLGPRTPIIPNSIVLRDEHSSHADLVELSQAVGICSSYIGSHKKRIEEAY